MTEIVKSNPVGSGESRLPRARSLGVVISGGRPGKFNAITDVPGVAVGMTTLVSDLDSDGGSPGSGPIRTGVTVILPHEGDAWTTPVFGGFSRLNGCGEFTGMQWLEESGMLMSPIAITSTHSLGAVHEGLLRAALASRSDRDASVGLLPVVAETWDGVLNDGFGFHVRPEHVTAALAAASTGPVPEGNVGGGTGMICHGFKGGTGTSSRVVRLLTGDEFTVGVLVQANHGKRRRLVIEGVPVGEIFGEDRIPIPSRPEGLGSIIGIIATDAPLLPEQCTRLARRAELAVGRTGGVGEHGSGDMFLAFSTAAAGELTVGYGKTADPTSVGVRTLSNAFVDPLFEAVVGATEESIVNALFAAQTMTGRGGVRAIAVPAAEVASVIVGGTRGHG
jgi:D-aminopeptidase